VAWINQTSSGGKVFYTSLGHVEDFKKPAFNQLLKNGIYWCIDQ
jgi:type 1 glutamine amidotransferase